MSRIRIVRDDSPLVKSTRVKLRGRQASKQTPSTSTRLAGDGMLDTMRARRLRELRRAGLVNLEPVDNADPEQVMNELLSNALGYMRWARDEVGKLAVKDFWLIDPRTSEKIPAAEFELEMRLLVSVKQICESIMRFDLDTRGVEIEETKVEIISTALQEAARQAGLDEDQQRRLGSALRTQLELVEGGKAG